VGRDGRWYGSCSPKRGIFSKVKQEDDKMAEKKNLCCDSSGLSPEEYLRVICDYDRLPFCEPVDSKDISNLFKRITEDYEILKNFKSGNQTFIKPVIVFGRIQIPTCSTQKRELFQILSEILKYQKQIISSRDSANEWISKLQEFKKENIQGMDKANSSSPKPTTMETPVHLNIQKKGSETMITATCLGVDPEDLRVETRSNVLKISGHIDLPKSGEGQEDGASEMEGGDFTREIELPFRIREARARSKKGMLEITLVPEKEEAWKAVFIKSSKGFFGAS